jgi:hypothetical protein
MLGLNRLLLCVGMFLLFFYFIVFNKKKIRVEDEDFFFRVAFQILYVVFPDISVHCALIGYAYK